MPDQIQMLIELALQEDIGSGDITTEAIFEKGSFDKKAVITAKQDLVVAGLEIAKRTFITVDHHLKWQRYFEDGDVVKKGQKVADIEGNIASLLKGERVALNFLQHLSGIATFTRLFVERVKKQPVKILDTRKTTPGMRALEKHAVRVGDGKNHRLGLYDRYLIKENHLRGNAIKDVVALAKKKNVNKVPIEIEVRTVEEAQQAVQAGVNIILFDNFSAKDLKKIVQVVKQEAERSGNEPLLEASGGINLDNVLDYAKTGVDFISIGALTHSAPAADLSMTII